jgi:hypothetical protein
MGPENKERHAMRASEAKFAAHATNAKNVGLIRFGSLRAALDNVAENCGVWPRAPWDSWLDGDLALGSCGPPVVGRAAERHLRCSHAGAWEQVCMRAS